MWTTVTRSKRETSYSITPLWWRDSAAGSQHELHYPCWIIAHFNPWQFSILLYQFVYFWNYFQLWFKRVVSPRHASKPSEKQVSHTWNAYSHNRQQNTANTKYWVTEQHTNIIFAKNYMHFQHLTAILLSRCLETLHTESQVDGLCKPTSVSIKFCHRSATILNSSYKYLSTAPFIHQVICSRLASFLC